MNNNGMFRKKKIYFSQVSNVALRDNNISLKAKGLYALIQSYITIEDFVLYKNTLQQSCKEGRDSFNSAWNELKKHGYLIQYKLKDSSGAFYYEYELLDEPYTENPLVENVKTIYGKSTPGKSTHGKLGIYNNTNNTNTDLNNTNTSSSSKKADEIDLAKEFEENICELKKTTKPKFCKLIENNNPDMVLAVIEECANTNVKSFRGFEVAFTSYLERKCKTREDVIKAAAEYRVKKKAKRTYKKKSNGNGQDPNKFNNFKPREYDYNSLEKTLLGWDKDE